MKVLFLFNGPYPDGMAMSRRLHLYAKGLLNQGMVPEIIFPTEKHKLASGYYEGIAYNTFVDPIIFKNYIMRQVNSIIAAYYYGYFCFRLAKKYDVIFVCGFGWFSYFLMLFGAYLRNSRVVLEVNENPYSPEGGRLDPEWLRRLRRFLMLHLVFKNIDGFIVISEPLELLVNKYKKKTAHIIKIPILTDNPSSINNISASPESPYILHAGALSETKDGVIAVFQAFAKACQQTSIPIKFVLTLKVLHPALKAKLESVVNTNNLGDRIIFKGFLTSKVLDDLRNSSTMAIINKPQNWQNDYNFPTKLGELLSAGVPVIASLTGEMSRYLKDNETAFLVPPNDSDAIAEKILFILNNPKIAAKVGENGRKLAKEKFCYLNYSEKLYAFFYEVNYK